MARQVESGKVTIHGLGLLGSHPFPKEDMDIQRRNHRNRNRKVITFTRAAWIYEQLIIGILIQRNTIIGSTVGHIIVIAWLVFIWTPFFWMGLPMISCSYFVHGMTGFPMNIIHMNRSLYDQLFLYLVMAYLVFLWTAFLYLRSYVCVPIFIHGINGLPISVHRIIGFLMNGLPIIAFLYLRSYDCVFLYPCLPVERGGSSLRGTRAT